MSCNVQSGRPFIARVLADRGVAVSFASRRGGPFNAGSERVKGEVKDEQTWGRPALVVSTVDPEIQRFLDEWLPTIRGQFAPEAIVLFGSRADGTADEWSDIDVVVVSRRFEGLGVFERFRVFDEAVHPHWHVDVICATPEEFERRREGANIIAEAVRSGLRILQLSHASPRRNLTRSCLTTPAVRPGVRYAPGRTGVHSSGR